MCIYIFVNRQKKKQTRTTRESTAWLLICAMSKSTSAFCVSICTSVPVNQANWAPSAMTPCASSILKASMQTITALEFTLPRGSTTVLRPWILSARDTRGGAKPKMSCHRWWPKECEVITHLRYNVVSRSYKTKGNGCGWNNRHK